jgi:hypothetical protein
VELFVLLWLLSLTSRSNSFATASGGGLQVQGLADEEIFESCLPFVNVREAMTIEP